jgi:hypothetical protein
MAIRSASLFSARPYIAYVDEGNFLNPVIALLRHGGWDPGWYLYPQLPIVAVAALLRVWSPIYLLCHGSPLDHDLSDAPEIYDVLEPFDVLVAARAINLALEAAIVVLTALFARRLAGPRAGVAAAWLASLAPALAIRGAIAAVDPYATFFILVCLTLTDVSRTSRHAGLASFGAGLAAGCAFASKYPSVVVLAAFAVTTLVSSADWTRRIGRMTLALAGLVAGAALAMPALVSHPRDVYDAIRAQAAIYGQMPSPPLWRQALIRAEWDLPYERAELGFALVAFAAAGLALAVERRSTRATACGWMTYGALTFLLLRGRAFQPFRNLLPLVPIVAIAAAILYVRVRGRLRRPRLLDAAAFAWLLVAFALPLTAHARGRIRLADTRTQAMDLLVAASSPADAALFQKELGFLERELSRLPGRRAVRPWTGVGAAAARLEPRLLVVGIMNRIGQPAVELSELAEIRSAYAVRIRIGETLTPAVDSWWRGNRQIVYVMERRKWRRGRDLNPW